MTETKVIELVIVADHSEVSSPGPAGPPRPRPPRRLSRPPLHPQVQRYPDAQHLVNRTLEVALLLDTVSVGPSGTRQPRPAPGSPALSPSSSSALPAVERACGAGGPGDVDPGRPDRDTPGPECHVAQLPSLAPGQPAASFAPRQRPAGDVRAPGCRRSGLCPGLANLTPRPPSRGPEARATLASGRDLDLCPSVLLCSLGPRWAWPSRTPSVLPTTREV